MSFLGKSLGIMLITYNRASFLSSTLKALSCSPFRDCSLTVVDNCSPDSTEEIAMHYTPYFRQFKYIRNRLNIGGNPNYLKAIELSATQYTWVLCDDDFLDFSQCDDIIQAIESDSFDLIEVGATERRSWPRGTGTSAKTLVDKGLDYFFAMSFFPAYIFRTSLFDSSCFCWGYKHIDDLYPQFDFLNKSVSHDFSIYLAQNRIVTRNEVNDHAFSPFAWYASWVTSCRSISDSTHRAQAIEDATASRGFIKCVLFWMVFDKSLNDGDFLLRVFKVFRTYTATQKIKFLCIFPLAMLPIPFSFWRWLRMRIYRYMNVPDSEIPPLHIVDRG